uniref:Probable ATP-dependent transporter ycf16 n=1 Tax=Boldia erythrosiphon TaxID=74908 RepID=A0A1Y9TLX7_9RHOD|nr:manganese transport system ATP-binding protein [Boldia erythrosiphon]ARO90647.1 manganese transport system ATP-binding protein [Boldia erythrosiphon]
MKTNYIYKKQFSVCNLSVLYKNKIILDNISFSVECGEMIGIIGPNGAGKSSLIKAILGIIPIKNGTIRYGKKLLKDQREKIAYIPQRSYIDWDYPVTVWDVVMMGQISGTRYFSEFSSNSYNLAKSSLKKLGMYNYKTHSIRELSGGQQQRVFLARALAQQAEILCLDEPLSGVDYKTQKIIFQLLKELCIDKKIILVVHHDLGDMVKYFNKLILLNKTIIAKGPSNEVLQNQFLDHTYGE